MPTIQQMTLGLPTRMRGLQQLAGTRPLVASSTPESAQLSPSGELGIKEKDYLCFMVIEGTRGLRADEGPPFGLDESPQLVNHRGSFDFEGKSQNPNGFQFILNREIWVSGQRFLKTRIDLGLENKKQQKRVLKEGFFWYLRRRQRRPTPINGGRHSRVRSETGNGGGFLGSIQEHQERG
ncbi:hypothetical protein V6N13_063738 [Hibiscus sabdariffa]